MLKIAVFLEIPWDFRGILHDYHIYMQMSGNPSRDHHSQTLMGASYSHSRG